MITDEIVEKAARAACKMDMTIDPDTEIEGDPVWRLYTAQVRAAIEAILPDLIPAPKPEDRSDG